MTTYTGLILLAGILIGGVHLYRKVERLDNLITRQNAGERAEADDDLT